MRHDGAHADPTRTTSSPPATAAAGAGTVALAPRANPIRRVAPEPRRRSIREVGPASGPSSRSRPASPTSPRSSSPATRAASGRRSTGTAPDSTRIRTRYLGASESALDEAVARPPRRYLETDAGPARLHRLDHDGSRLALQWTAPAPRATRCSRPSTTSTPPTSRCGCAAVRDGVDRTAGAPLRRARAGRRRRDRGPAHGRASRRRTRVVAITWVHSSTGVKLPVRAIADALATVNAGRGPADRALLCVDGVHGFGVEDAAPDSSAATSWSPAATSGCSARAAPASCGAGRRRGPRYTPVIPTFSRRHGRIAPPRRPPAHPRRLPQLRAPVGAGRGVRVPPGDRPDPGRRTHPCPGRPPQGRAGRHPKVRLRTPRATELSAGIVCCEVDGYGPADAVAALREAKVHASATPYAPSLSALRPQHPHQRVRCGQSPGRGAGSSSSLAITWSRPDARPGTSTAATRPAGLDVERDHPRRAGRPTAAAGSR